LLTNSKWGENHWAGQNIDLVTTPPEGQMEKEKRTVPLGGGKRNYYGNPRKVEGKDIHWWWRGKSDRKEKVGDC